MRIKGWIKECSRERFLFVRKGYYALSGLFILWYRSFLHRAAPYVHGLSPFRAKSGADPADSNLLGRGQGPKSPEGAGYTNDGHRPSYGEQPDGKP